MILAMILVPVQSLSIARLLCAIAVEKDDFKYTMSFGDDLFGGPPWKDYVDKATGGRIAAAGAGSTVPLALDAHGEPLRRNFVHVEDLVAAMLAALGHPAARQQKFNICMDEPVDYSEAAAYLAATRGIPSVECKTEWHSTWLDNSKAKFKLGWRPVCSAEGAALGKNLGRKCLPNLIFEALTLSLCCGRSTTCRT